MKSQHLLKGDYLDAYQRIKEYGRATDVDEEFLTECMEDLGDVLLDAQQENRPPEKILGRNEEEFCRAFFSAYTKEGRLVNLNRGIRSELALILCHGILQLLEAAEMGASLLTATVNGWMLFWMVVCALTLGVQKLLLPRLMQKYYYRMKNPGMVTGMSALGLLLLSVAVTFALSGTALSRIPALPVTVLVAGYLATYALLSARHNLRTTGHLFSPRKKRCKSERKAAGRENFNLKLAWELKRKYERENEKRLRRGREPRTAEEFTASFARETRKMRGAIRVWFVLWLGLMIASVAAVVLVQDADVLWSWFPALLGADVGALAGLLFLRWVTMPRTYLLRRCREQGVTVVDATAQKPIL